MSGQAESKIAIIKALLKERELFEGVIKEAQKELKSIDERIRFFAKTEAPLPYSGNCEACKGCVAERIDGLWFCSSCAHIKRNMEKFNKKIEVTA